MNIAKHNQRHIAIIGGGAAGMMAAIIAARNGAAVTILERQNRVGRKLLATGNGRCNITNTACSVKNYHGVDPGFIFSALRQFPVDNTLELFRSLGICTTVEDKGRVFPLTGQASSVLDVLRYEIERSGVSVRVDADIAVVGCKGDRFGIRWSEGEIEADRVIITTGGKAMPQLGGTATGMEILMKMGHTVEPVFPALVPLKADPHFGPRLKGIKVFGKVWLTIAGRHCGKQEGEIHFAEYGFSGPPIIQVSHDAGQALQEGHSVKVTLDLFPDWSEKQLLDEIGRRFAARPEAPVQFILIGLLQKRLIPVILRESGIPEIHEMAYRLSKTAPAGIAGLLKRWPFTITGSLSWNDAQVMGGGIRTAEFSPETLASRLLKGLYAAGEVLDITGDSGGFNLQWAWSSGYVAGLHAATG